MSKVSKHLEEHWDAHFDRKGNVDYTFDYSKMGARDKRVVEALASCGDDGKSCLDVGFGTGRWLQYLKQEGASYLGGVDISPTALKRVEEVCDHAHLADLEEDSLQFESDFFDIVVSFEVLEHLRNPELYLNEIFRVMKPDALLMISVPNLTSFGSRFRMLIGRQPNCFGDQTHMRHYTHRALMNLLSSHGFSVVFHPTSISLDPANFSSKFKIPSNQLIRTFEDGIVLSARKMK